jgi:hypothetical protein
MKRFVVVALVAMIAAPSATQPIQELPGRLDIAVRKAVRGALMHRFQPPSLHSPDSGYLAWRYGDQEFSLQYTLASTIEEARDGFAKAAVVRPIPTRPVAGIVGDEAFIVSHSARLHFRRGRFNVEVNAPDHLCVGMGSQVSACPEAPKDPLTELPLPPRLVTHEVVNLGYDGALRFALLVDAEILKMIRSQR